MSDPEILNETEESYKIPLVELEKRYEKAYIDCNIALNKEREFASAFYGYYKGWNSQRVAKHYNVSIEFVHEIWNNLGFENKGGEKMNRTKSKQDSIVGYLRQNIGQVITPAQLSKDVSVSLPTFYNFYNANRHFFKKVKRGQFEILNPEQERQKS
jgi:hypothetical protein